MGNPFMVTDPTKSEDNYKDGEYLGDVENGNLTQKGKEVQQARIDSSKADIETHQKNQQGGNPFLRVGSKAYEQVSQAALTEAKNMSVAWEDKDLSNEDPDELLQEMVDNEFNTFQQVYSPMMDELEKEATSTELVDTAREKAATYRADSEEIANRSMERMGAYLTPAQKRSADRVRNGSAAVSEATSVNNARNVQQKIQESATNDLMTTASALQSGSTSALTTISQNAYAREKAYEEAKSGFTSNVMGAVGGIAGGMIGGPIGASIGSAIGSQVGGSM